MNLIQILMTPNVVINNILTFLFAIVEAYIYMIFFGSFLKITPTRKQKIIYILITVFIGYLSNLIIPNPYLYIINLLCFTILLYTLFKQSIKNIFIALITTYSISFISAFCIQTILKVSCNISYVDITTIPLYRLIAVNLTYFAIYLISIVIKKKNNISGILKLSLKFTTIVTLFLGIITIFIQTYIFSIYKDAFPIELKIIALLSQILYFFLSIYSIIRTNQLEETTEDLETEKIYNKTLTLLHDNIRCFKHDFNNIVQSIGGYIELKDISGLEKYYASLLDECKLTNNLNILNPETINNPSIYSLLTNKYYLASEKGITITFNIFTDLSKLNCNIYELTRILGILLDNSIEAAAETSEKNIEITIRSDNQKQLFIIENSCIDNNISITKIFEKGYSTKEKNSGIGLWKVHNILSKNTQFDLFTTIKNNKFKQELSVFYN